MLSEKGTTNTLISLRGCAGWSVPLLFATQITGFLVLRPKSYDCHFMEYAVLFVYFNNDSLLRQLVDLCVCMDVILFNNMTPKQINKLFAKELV